MNKDEFVALFKEQPYEVQEACVMSFELPEPQILTFGSLASTRGIESSNIDHYLATVCYVDGTGRSLKTPEAFPIRIVPSSEVQGE